MIDWLGQTILSILEYWELAALTIELLVVVLCVLLAVVGVSWELLKIPVYYWNKWKQKREPSSNTDSDT